MWIIIHLHSVNNVDKNVNNSYFCVFIGILPKTKYPQFSLIIVINLRNYVFFLN